MPSLTLLSSLTPPSNTRTWQTQPHTSLPIVATASSDRTVRIYSLTSFTLLSSVSGGHKRSIRSVAWKPGTRRGEAVLATGSFDASAGIWKKYYSGEDEEARLERQIGAMGDDENDEDDEYNFTVLLDGHESEIKSLGFSPSSRLLATCSRDKSVWIWEELDDDNWETVAVLQEHDGDVKCVAWHPSEDLLVSASYDESVRVYKEDVDDWIQVAVILGHEGTVWWVQFEGAELSGLVSSSTSSDNLSQGQRDYIIHRKGAGPRLISCSDDLSIRVWKRLPKEKNANSTQNNGVPSIIRSQSIDEDWVEEARLPCVHERTIYSASWSAKSGLVVSAGSDGKIVVYKEQWKAASTMNGTSGEAHQDQDTTMMTGTTPSSTALTSITEWAVIAEIEAAHDVFEINHVTWAKRWDKGRRNEDEEVIITTGDDGEVKVWTLDGV